MTLCLCGCGEPVAVAKKTQRKYGHIAGQPVRFRPGHNQRTPEARARVSAFRPGRFVTPEGRMRQAAANARPGARVIDKEGYVLVKMHGHPLADYKGYVREHRLVMSLRIGRLLRPEERPHHVDGDKQNNDPGNLWLFPNQTAHGHWHEIEKNGRELSLFMPAVPLAP